MCKSTERCGHLNVNTLCITYKDRHCLRLSGKKSFSHTHKHTNVYKQLCANKFQDVFHFETKETLE